MSGPAPDIAIRAARVDDAERILRLVNELATLQIMLPRSPASVIENIRDFVIAEVEGHFAGCAGLHVVWTDIAEIRSIAVDPQHRKLGLGRMMAERLIRGAMDLRIASVFCFTYVEGFFRKLGFEVVDHASLPHKVFNDCINCPKFHACDEIAMLRVLRELPENPKRGPLSRPVTTALPWSSIPRRTHEPSESTPKPSE